MNTNTITKTQRLKSMFAASSGNLVEWYDFYIYAFSATYFAHHFSSSNDKTLELIMAYGIFAIGFLMRPIGSWLFGSMADKIGRKKSMVYSVLLMALCSFALAILPTNNSIGNYAALLLLIVRMLQGLSVGGEYGIVAAYLSELGDNGKRGFYSSFQYVTLIGGQLLAVFSAIILELIFSQTELRDYAWRFLFALGGIFALLSLLIRKNMHETTNLQKEKNKGSFKELLKYKKSFLLVLGFTAGGSLCFYTFTTYSKTFMENTIGYSSQMANYIMFSALFFYMILQPIFGILGDKIGRKNLLIAFSILGIIFTYPIFILLGSTSNPYIAFLAILLLLIILSFYTSIGGVLKAELFPVQVRALGTGLSYAIGNAIFGGSAGYIALQFKHYGIENGFFIYLVIMLIVCLYVAIILPKKTELD